MSAVPPSKSPLVTVGIPSYNSAAFLGETLRSVLAQTYSNLEILVADDASTDDSVRVVESFHDPRLRVRHNPRNLGAVENWNGVLADANGEFVKLLHSDDYLEPDAIRQQVEALVAHPEAVLASSRRRIVDESGKKMAVLGARWPSGLRAGTDTIREIVRRGANLIGEPSAVLMRADALEAAGGFDAASGYVVDLDLWTRLLRIGDLYFSAKPLVAYRVRSGQWSRDLVQEQAQDAARLLTRLGSDPSLGIPASELRRGISLAKGQANLRRLLYLGLEIRSQLSR